MKKMAGDDDQYNDLDPIIIRVLRKTRTILDRQGYFVKDGWLLGTSCAEYGGFELFLRTPFSQRAKVVVPMRTNQRQDVGRRMYFLEILHLGVTVLSLQWNTADEFRTYWFEGSEKKPWYKIFLKSKKKGTSLWKKFCAKKDR